MGLTSASTTDTKPYPSLADHNLPAFNPDFFVGREEPLKELRRLLTSGQGPAVITQAITGLGGIGKTQTALVYCYRHLTDYRLIWWLRAESAATLAVDYATLAEPLGLDPTVADQEKLLSSIRTTLQATGLWLLVFDNVEDPQLPRRYLPSTGSGHVLITSRRTDWGRIAKPLPLQPLPQAEALQLLTAHPDPEALPAPDLAEAKALVEELGRLPLALTQARAYVDGTGQPFAEYRALLALRRKDLLRRGVPNDYELPVLLTWGPSLEAAEKECSAARPLLELLAFFAADPLPRTVLVAAPEALPEPLRDPLALDDAITALSRFSLVTAAQGMLTVHRLVQAVTRDGLDEATAKARAETAIRLAYAALPRPTQEHTNWPAIGLLLSHALAAAEAAERLGAGLEAAATVLNQAALYHPARAYWAEAEPLYQRAIAITEKALGPEHPTLATYLNNLAELYLYDGRYAKAEPLLLRAIDIGEKALSPEHPEFARGLNNVAGLYWTTGRYAEAEPLYQRAIAITEKALGPEHPWLATNLSNLALLYRATGRYAEAEPLYARALAIDEKALSPDHPDLATRLNNLALLYQDTGRYAEAEPLLKRAIAIGEQTLGPEHPTLAQFLNNLAGLYRATGRYAEAEPLYARALAIDEKALSPDHPDLATRLNNLALLYQDTGRYAEAEPLLKRAIAIGEQTLGPEHPTLAQFLNNLAELYRATGRYAEAEPLYQRAIAITEKALGPEHPTLAQFLNNLAGLYRATGRYAEAEPLFARALTIFEKALPADHPYQRFGRENYALLLDQLGRNEEAAALRAAAAPPGPHEGGGTK